MAARRGPLRSNCRPATAGTGLVLCSTLIEPSALVCRPCRLCLPLFLLWSGPRRSRRRWRRSTASTARGSSSDSRTRTCSARGGCASCHRQRGRCGGCYAAHRLWRGDGAAAQPLHRHAAPSAWAAVRLAGALHAPATRRQPAVAAAVHATAPHLHLLCCLAHWWVGWVWQGQC